MSSSSCQETLPCQVFHAAAQNKQCSDSAEGWLFREKYLKRARAFTTDAQVLKFGSDSVSMQGLFIELGVCDAKTINFIAALNPLQTIYGFDSFEGLPEDWKKGNDILKKGTFAFKDAEPLPMTLNNVKLIKGWFQDTLQEFSEGIDAGVPIAFMHVDCDIYSSTATAFEFLGRRIQPGTILIFDELYNYPGFEQHEFKAFQEFLESASLQARYLAYNSYHEQVAVQIIDR